MARRAERAARVVPATQAQARRRRRPRRRARPSGASGHGSAADGRRQRVVDARGGARRGPAARGARRGVLRAAAEGGRRRWARAEGALPDPDLRRRGLPHARRRREVRRDRAWREHQAREVGRHPRGDSHRPRRPRAAYGRDARLHARVRPRDRGGMLRRAALRPRRPRREPAAARGPVAGRRVRRRRPDCPRRHLVSACPRTHEPAAPHPHPRRGLLARRPLRQDDARDRALRARPGGRDPRLEAPGGDARGHPDRRQRRGLRLRTSRRSPSSGSRRRVAASLRRGGIS